MSALPGADLCRITVVGPSRRVDIALPADATFAELYPTMLRYAGQNLADSGLAHGGWVLQKLDEAPFDPASTPSQAGLRDGDLIYLRPRMAQIPDMVFDDVPDVVATGVRDRPGRWRQDSTRKFALGWGVAGLVVGALTLLLAGPSWIASAAVAGGVCLLLLGAAIVLSRAVGDAGAGAAIGYAALPYAFLAGLLGPLRDDALTDIGALHLVAGFGAVVLAATVAGIAIADGLPVFYGIAIAALLGTINSGISLSFDMDAAGIAAVTATVALALTPLLPGVAFKLARVQLPPVPGSAEDLRRDTLMVDGQALLSRTAVADRFVTGGVSAIGLATLGAVVPLSFDGGWVSPVMCVVLAFTVLLRARIFRARAQKLWLLIPGVAGLGTLAVATAFDIDSQMMLLAIVLVPTLVVSGIAAGVGMWLPGNRLTPFWGRAGDILEIILVVALVPLALGVAGVFDYVRTVVG
ncbi:type VII secretion integral membrane protein EccD [Actinomadura darangshiensis]|uniref:Type VII secretion integral membrane protein EccD n=1 Tax=Actinomadura darangshiensis TaxID=705336 RepID=A0A4R5B9W8_9ACTN|nr:type VII secretion integral membrane protein EccD [Actinomadura darangshiensis]TDD80504.1 type VII secretion integral membrane protein EccD [Actinomadura darangshiensis]